MKKWTLIAVLFVFTIASFVLGTTKVLVQNVAYEEGPDPMNVPTPHIAYEEGPGPLVVTPNSVAFDEGPGPLRSSVNS